MNDDSFLQHVGGLAKNSLVHTLDLHKNDDLDITFNPLITLSPYYDNSKFFETIKRSNSFSIFGTNIQSVNAKFDELNIFVNELQSYDFNFSVLCLQECWLASDDDTSQFELDGYNIIPQGRSSCSTRGGLITYIDIKYNYDIYKSLKYDSWEGQIIKLYNGGLKEPIYVLNINTYIGSCIKYL